MDFTYDGYKRLMWLLKEHDYQIVGYHNYRQYNEEKICILRHDIDNDIQMAMKLVELETSMGIHSTWFVLVSSNFYNPFSKENRKMLRQIAEGGHNIGLHFDEVAYGGLSVEEKLEAAEEERGRLERGLGIPIRSVSMHRPSKEAVEGDWKFANMINSYSQEFFHGFKYLSDSRRRWRESVEEIIESGEYQRLHILTHAFWYNDTEMSLHDSVLKFINSGNHARYEWMGENITDLPSIVDIGEVNGDEL